MEVKRAMLSVDRYRGCLLGLAAGDALGTTLEFRRPETFEPITGIMGGGPFGLLPGQWTDDTSMALCLAKSLIEKNGFDPVDQMQQYLRWYRTGDLSSTGMCFDIGMTTRRALEEFASTGKPFCGSTHPQMAGNGCIMRLAPVPMFFAKSPAEAIAMSGESSRTTHGAPTAVDGCRFLGALVVGALNAVPKDELLAAGYWTGTALTPEIEQMARGSYKERMPPQIRGTGYVVDCLEAALWAFHRSNSFREGALLAVNLGDDADTTGAVYGQIAGAHYGVKGIPGEWLGVLAHRELITSFADQLFQRASLDQP